MESFFIGKKCKFFQLRRHVRYKDDFRLGGVSNLSLVVVKIDHLLLNASISTTFYHLSQIRTHLLRINCGVKTYYFSQLFVFCFFVFCWYFVRKCNNVTTRKKKFFIISWEMLSCHEYYHHHCSTLSYL